MDQGLELSARQALDSELPRSLQVPRRTFWWLKTAALFLAGTALVMPLEAALASFVGLPPWVVFILCSVAIFWYPSRVFGRSAKDSQDCVALLRAGDMDVAFARLELAMKRAPGIFKASFATMLGAVEIELGRTTRGLAILDSARRSGWFDGAASAQARAAMHACLASGLADLGDDERAIAELERAQQELPANFRGLLLADQVLVLARAGQHAELQKYVAADLDAAEQILPAWTIKWIRTLHCYSRALSDSGYRTAVDDDVRMLLGDPRARASAIRLGQRWPELAAYLATQGVQSVTA